MNKATLTTGWSAMLFLYVVLWAVAAACSGEGADKERSIPAIARMKQYTTTKKYPGEVGRESLAAWKKDLPEIEVAQIKSTVDGKAEPALFYTSGSSRKKPLLVLLHSWSSGYLQVPSLPFALWARKYDWAFIQPNYRGVFDHPEAMASDLAIQDIVDAVQYARRQANIDTSRIYLVGSSGGAMTALVAASRHPDIWAGVVAWVPIFDLTDWYQFNLHYPHRIYNNQMSAALGGAPLPGTAEAEEARRRSPSTQLYQAQGVPVFLAHGINDLLVPADHSIRAFNVLAHPEDTISQEHMDYIVAEQALPPELQGAGTDPYFSGEDPAVVFSRESADVRLVLFEGVHDMAYNPTLLWLSEQQQGKEELMALHQAFVNTVTAGFQE